MGDVVWESPKQEHYLAQIILKVTLQESQNTSGPIILVSREYSRILIHISLILAPLCAGPFSIIADETSHRR